MNLSPELATIKARFFKLASSATDDSVFDLAKIYPDTDNTTVLLSQLSDLKRCLDSFRPLSSEQVAHLNEVFDTEYTYESNRIEGNTLTLRETDLIINKGMTVSGKKMQEHLEAVNHKNAIGLIRDLAQHNVELTEESLKKIHAIILSGIDIKNAGAWRTERVRIVGSRHVCPNPLKIPVLMSEFFAYYNQHKNLLHPVEIAAVMHEKLVSIHPFIDGNGRTARLMMNLILLQHGYPITIISADYKSRDRYYQTLEMAQVLTPDDNHEFIEFIALCVKQWFFVYLELFANSIDTENQDKGYYFFKTIEAQLYEC